MTLIQPVSFDSEAVLAQAWKIGFIKRVDKGLTKG